MNRHVAALLALMVLGLSNASACVGCREPGLDTVSNEPSTVLAGFGLSWGVLIMLGTALTIVGSLVAYICRTISRLDNPSGGR